MRRPCAAMLLTALLVAVTPYSVSAASERGSTPGEIKHLLARLGDSGCRFQRNGDWHDADEARAHLQRKYEYLRKRGRIESAEQFIASAATGSSLSGKAYAVQCHDQPAVPSAQWLGAELRRIRSGAVNPAPE